MWFQLLQVDVVYQHVFVVFLRAMKSQRNNTGCDLTTGLNINPGRVPTVATVRTRLHPRQTQHVWTMWHFQPGALRTSLATQHSFLPAKLQFKKKKKNVLPKHPHCKASQEAMEVGEGKPVGPFIVTHSWWTCLRHAALRHPGILTYDFLQLVRLPGNWPAGCQRRWLLVDGSRRFALMIRHDDDDDDDGWWWWWWWWWR